MLKNAGLEIMQRKMRAVQTYSLGLITETAMTEEDFLKWCDDNGYTWRMRRVTESKCGGIEVTIRSGDGGTMHISTAPSPGFARREVVRLATRKAKNSRIGKLLMWFQDGGYWYGPDSNADWEHRSERLPDFYTDPEANNDVLEALLKSGHTYSISLDTGGYAYAEYQQFISCWPHRYPDLMTAICECFLAEHKNDK